MLTRDFIDLKWAVCDSVAKLPTTDEFEASTSLLRFHLSVCDVADDAPSDTVQFEIHNGHGDGLNVCFGMAVSEVAKLRDFLAFLIDHRED